MWPRTGKDPVGMELRAPAKPLYRLGAEDLNEWPKQVWIFKMRGFHAKRVKPTRELNIRCPKSSISKPFAAGIRDASLVGGEGHRRACAQKRTVPAGALIR